MRKVIGTSVVGDMPGYVLKTGLEERLENYMRVAERLHEATLSHSAYSGKRG